MIRLKFRDGPDLLDTLLLDNRPDVGPELNHVKAPGCEASTSATLDIPVRHCQACSTDIADLIGLTLSEVDRIRRWNEASKMSPDERRNRAMTPRDLGAILDKIVDSLDRDEHDCDRNDDRIVVEVEPTP